MFFFQLLAQLSQLLQTCIDSLPPCLDVPTERIGVSLDAAEPPHRREEAGVLLPQTLHIQLEEQHLLPHCLRLFIDAVHHIFALKDNSVLLQ